jgi:hypothetical protein
MARPGTNLTDQRRASAHRVIARALTSVLMTILLIGLGHLTAELF